MGNDKSTTRREFVLGGAALLASCGGETETTAKTSPGGAGGEGGEGAGGTGGDNTGAADGAGGVPGSGGTGGNGGAGGSGGAAGTNGSGGAAGTDGAAGTAGVAGTGTGGADAGICTLYPLQTEGPYYLDLNLLRRNIAEGKTGEQMNVVIQVLRASDCTPLANVAVDIWQCDAAGVYGGFPGQLGGLDTTGQTYLRGTLLTGTDGKVTFDTIYPGWYPGRTTHIHFKVHPSSTTEATSQMYFPEDFTAQIYATGVYAARGQKDTTNAADGVNRGVAPLATITRAEGRFQAELAVAVVV